MAQLAPKSNHGQHSKWHNLLRNVAQLDRNRWHILLRNEWHILLRISQWFGIKEKNQLLYSSPASNTGVKSYNDFFQYFQDTLDEDYYSFLEEVDVDNDEAIYSFSYYWFLRSYFSKNVDREAPEYKELPKLEASMRLYEAALRGADVELSGDAQRYFKQYVFSDVVRRFSDTTEVDSLAKVYGVKDYQHLLSGLGTRIMNENPDLGLVKGDTIPLLLLVDTQEKLRSLKDYDDKITYINIRATWCGPCIKNFPEYNKMISKYKDDERVPFINICIRSERDQWLKDIKRRNLGGINLYASGNWNDKLGSIFSLKGIPHYVLLDRENLLVENFAEKAPFAHEAIDKLLHQSNLH
ncbi:MAG: thiol-disulfide isomerase/thioredoxin [Saprospiraceae bacterium]